MRVMQLAYLGGGQRMGLRRRLVAVQHAIAHFLGLNQGYIESYWVNDRLWMFHNCLGCDKRERMFEWMDEEEYHTGI